ncbi:hypothetical protein Hanom_Chr14g01332631 [Helianthus anomalus]
MAPSHVPLKPFQMLKIPNIEHGFPMMLTSECSFFLQFLNPPSNMCKVIPRVSYGLPWNVPMRLTHPPENTLSKPNYSKSK